jgi:hypothetical protein
MDTVHPLEQINILWKQLLEKYPDGVSNTSTVKYTPIRQFLADLLKVPLEEVYATGAKTRTSNLDTRLVQGNQAGRHTKVGVAFLQREGDASELEKFSRSAVVTISKFVNGTDNTNYDVVLVFVEVGSEMLLTRIVQKSGERYGDLLRSHFPKAVVENISVSTGPAFENHKEPIESPALIAQEFSNALGGAGLHFSDQLSVRFIASLLTKRFLILTGLAGSGKTKIAQAFSQWISPIRIVADVFVPGTSILSERITYFVKRSDAVSVEFWNSETETEATKVVLPREMIKEWADYIRENGISDNVSAREIREAVKAHSQFSDQLHSFETHLKAAAFSMLRAQELGPLKNCYMVIPVGSDWSGNENILGYPNGLVDSEYVLRPALELILQAEKYPDIPHFLILDEMNLSHVERYFSDILSSLESGADIPLYSGSPRTAGNVPIPIKIRIPPNLFIIGTVNVDETTYMFSPKVLDRANTIEFRLTPTKLREFLVNPAAPDLEKLAGQGTGFGRLFVGLAKSRVELEGELANQFVTEIAIFFDLLYSYGAEFGYRTSHEAARFLYYYNVLENSRNSDITWNSSAFDGIIAQKILPKLHGSRSKLAPILKALWMLCVPSESPGDKIHPESDGSKVADVLNMEPTPQVPQAAKYPISAEKIGRMWRQLGENGFTSFAEA